MFPCLSIKSNVIPAPRTGNDVTKRTETTKIAQPIRQKWSMDTPVLLAIARLTRNVIAPNSEESPNTWRKNTPIDTDADEEKSIPVSGKYRVQPAAMPSWKLIPTNSNCIAKIDNQNARLLRRGVAKSIPAYVWGSTKLPRAEIRPGMMKRKTIPNPWLVTAR